MYRAIRGGRLAAAADLCYTAGMSDDRNVSAIPFFSEAVAAGFPCPAEGELKGSLDLNELCISNPPATYFVRARGESMRDAGISDGDILIVDRSLEARSGAIVIASLQGEFTVKTLELRAGHARLLPANPDYSPIDITPELGAEFFGVVTYVIRRLHR